MTVKQGANIFEFRQFGVDLKDVVSAMEEDFRELDLWLRGINNSEPVIFDLNGLEFIGYSYAKQTIRRTYHYMMNGEYGIRSILLRYDGDDGDIKLDGVRYALNERRITCILENGTEGTYQLFGYLAYEDNDFETVKDRNKRQKMKSVVELLLSKKELYTNEVAKLLDLKLPYCNRLLDDLTNMRLLYRIKETSPSGGPIYLNRAVVV